MDIIRAREIIRSLAEGVDPNTGEVLSKESVYHKPDVIRALYTILEATNPAPVPPAIPHPNAGKPWSDIEDDKLRDEFDARMKISEIAKEHGRTRGAIESRLEYLSLKKKRYWFLKKQK